MKENLPTYSDINPYGSSYLDGYHAAMNFYGIDKKAAYEMFKNNLYAYSEDLGVMGEQAFKYYSLALYDYIVLLSLSSTCEADEFLTQSETILYILELRKVYYENSNYDDEPYSSICNICIQKLKTIQARAQEFISNSTLYLYSQNDINDMILKFIKIQH